MAVELTDHGGKGFPNYPYVRTAELTTEIPALISDLNTTDSPVVYSDQPAAIAWYADIHAIALPMSYDQFSDIEAYATKQEIEIAGIHTSAESTTHLWENREYSGILALVNLPVSANLSGVPIKPRIHNLNQFHKDPTTLPWYELSKNYPYSSDITTADLLQFRYGQHIFHSRKEPK